MGRPTKSAVTLYEPDQLVATAHVPLGQQVEEQDATERRSTTSRPDTSPGNVRPYGA